MIDFDDIFGHDEPISMLRRQLSSSKGAHALLLEGPSGVGKRLTALATAAAHLCDDPGGAGPCGDCRACRQIKAGSHYGLWLIDPDISEDERDPDNPEPVAGMLPRLFEDSSGAGTIGIDPVRSLREELSLKPSDDPRRAIVLADFDDATEDAQNALLKTLEEPPDDTLLLCTVTSREGIPATITSRCQRLRFHPLSPDQVIRILSEHTDLSEERKRFLARISGGRPGMALRFADGNLLDMRNWFIDQVEAYGGAEDPRFRQAVEDRLSGASSKREAFTDFMMLQRALLRDALYVRSGVEEKVELHFPEQLVRSFAGDRPVDRIIEEAERLEDLDTAQELYVNTKVLVENLPS